MIKPRAEMINEIRNHNEIAGGLFEMTATDLENLLARRDEMVVDFLAMELAASRGSYVAEDIRALKGKLR